ncbi:cytochrome P450 [Geodermatophilus sp. SYSU D00691]
MTEAHSEVDLADPGFWALPPAEQHAAFAALRRLDAPCWFAAPDEPGGGFWALVRHADVVAASKAPELFSSEPSVTTPPPERWVRAVFGESMVNMDGRRHTDLRRIVQKAFTPRRVALIEESIRRISTELVDDVLRRGSGDFVEAVAAQLPTHVICEMMGIPPERRGMVLRQVIGSTELIGVEGEQRPKLRIPGRNLAALARLHLLVRVIGAQRRRKPENDLVSSLVTADVDGERLGSRQLGAFFSLLLVAGIETTRNAIAHGLRLLDEHPDQRELLLADLDAHLPGAVDEMLRVSTPIVQFRRNVTRDVEWHGYRFRQGERVVLFYASANRDEDVFTDPDRFDITRSPNPHVAFGGTGPHYCLGAYLARTELQTLFRELLTRAPHVRLTGEPERIPSSFDNRIRRMPFTVEPA